MPVLILWILLFVLAIAFLVKGADWFTAASERLATRFGISSFVIGVTVVSIGTSLPELASSIFAVLKGEPGIVAGNVIGSNIANILLVLGLGAILAGELTTKRDMARVDIPILFGGTFLLVLMAMNGSINLIEALILLFGYGVYLHYLFKSKERVDKGVTKAMKEQVKEKFFMRVVLPLIAGGVLIYFGADWTVKSVINIAALTGITSGVIATTAVALGTSLPELFVTVMAGIRGKHEIAIGNIVGSNIFNVYCVMGFAALFGAIPVTGTLLTFALPALVMATFMFYLVIRDNSISKWEGWSLFLLYVFFLVRMFLA